MATLSPAMETFTLTTSLLLASYLTFKIWTPPRPTPSSRTAGLPRDDVGGEPFANHIRRNVFTFLWVWHASITCLFLSPPAMLCPNPENLSPSLFTWSSYTIAVLIVIGVAAPLRILAFRQLGDDFTFRLAEPKKLVKSGLYAYVQHPSYPTNQLVLVANIALLCRLDGVIGCVLPSVVVGTVVASRVWNAVLIVWSLLGVLGIWMRVRDEERMLKDKYGKEWEEWSVHTKRFIPYVI